MNHRVEIREDIKRYQDTPSYASSKVNYSMGQNIYMLPSDMNLKIKTGTVGYNNKILISEGKFSLGKNDEVNSLELAKVIALECSVKSYKVIAKPPLGGANNKAGQSQVPAQAKKPTTHEDEKIALVLSLAGIFMVWYMFQ